MNNTPNRPDYDSPWKNALEWHFQPFLDLCFPTIQTELNFHYPIIKLLDYKQHWDTLQNSHNPFATVIMAHLKAQQTQKNPQDRKTWKFNLTRNLYDQGHDKQTILNLYHFIDWVMTLPPDLEQQYLTDITHYEQTITMPYITNAERIGIEKGIEQGREQEREQGRKQQALTALTALTKVLTRRHTKLPKSLTTTLQKLTLEQLDRLLDIALDTNTLKDFTIQMQALISQP